MSDALKQISLTQRALWVCNIMYHQAIAIVLMYILWKTFYNLDINEKRTWHWSLTTLGYIAMMTEGVVLFFDDNVWLKNIDRPVKVLIHGGVLILGAIFCSVGIAFVIQRKIDENMEHFKSVHAWTGLVSWILILLSLFLGLLAANASNLKQIVKPIYLKFFHNLIAIVGFIFGIISLGFGLNTPDFRNISKIEARIVIWILLGFIGVWSLFASIKSLARQFWSILN